MATPSEMKSLYARLTDAGMPRQYVRNIALPEWWDDEATKTPAGLSQAKMIISRHLGIGMAALSDAKNAIQLPGISHCKFKKNSATSSADVRIASRIGFQAAQLAASATEREYKEVPCAEDLRQLILGRGEKWVGLKQLLDTCWNLGIPVLHVSELPRTTKKMDGMAVMTAGRPVIVICKNQLQDAWLSFVIAHELGHIHAGHVEQNSALVDEKVNRSSKDVEEIAADEFAISLLSGNRTYTVSDRWPNATTLAGMAQAAGADHLVDPGHIVLNYAHSMGKNFFAVANAALSIMYPHANAPGTISQSLSKHLNWDALPAESSEFLAKLTHASI